MEIIALRTHKIEVTDSLQEVLDKYVIAKEECIIAITSKIISVTQGRVIPKNNIDKKSLVYQEADKVFENENSKYDTLLTIKNGILIPCAGIDESNACEAYILYPENIQQTASWVWNYLRQKHNIKKLGVLITDSHTTIMRRGVSGIALGWCGFEPLYSYIGKPDIYNNPLKMTQLNILDSLASAAVFVMGEGNEQTPLAIITGSPKISFLDRPPRLEEQAAVTITMEEDIYAPLLKSAQWSETKVKKY